MAIFSTVTPNHVSPLPITQPVSNLVKASKISVVWGSLRQRLGGAFFGAVQSKPAPRPPIQNRLVNL